MKFIKISIFVFTILISNLSLNAQSTSDLGMIYGSTGLYRMNFEFRKPLNEAYKLKFGYIQGSNPNLYWGYPGKLTAVSDSLIVERFKSGSQLQFTLSTGVERRLKESMFSISADLLISYLRVQDGYYNEKRELSENNEWINTAGKYTMLDPSRALRKTNFINPGFQFKFSMDIPIEETFFLHLFVGQIISLPIYLNEAIVTDPMNEFKPQQTTFSFYSTSHVGIGLRYQFKNKSISHID